MGAAEAARKPNLPPRTETDGKNGRKAKEFLNSIDLGKVWPPLDTTCKWAQHTRIAVLATALGAGGRTGL